MGLNPREGRQRASGVNRTSLSLLAIAHPMEQLGDGFGRNVQLAGEGADGGTGRIVNEALADSSRLFGAELG